MIRRAWIALLLAAMAASAEETAGDPLAEYRPLLEDSPFLSIAFKERLARSKEGGAEAISFVGFAMVDGSWKVCLLPGGGEPATWTAVGEEISGFRIAGFDPEKRIVRLEKGSVSRDLEMKTP
jgi:hypothetical protein